MRQRGGEQKLSCCVGGRRKEGIHTRFVRLQRSSSSELGWVVKRSERWGAIHRKETISAHERAIQKKKRREREREESARRTRYPQP